MKLIISTIVCMLFFVTCNKKSSYEKTEFYENGKVKRMYYYVKDSNFYMYSIGYYPDGCFKDFIPYNKNLKINGIKVYNSKKSKEIHYIPFNNDKKNGLVQAFYYNNQLKIKGEYKQDKEIGEWYSYYKEGLIDTYFLYDNNGNFLYSKKYNYNKDTFMYKGNPVINIYYNDTLFNVGDTFILRINIAEPLNCYSSVFMVDKNQSILDSNLFFLDKCGDLYIYKKVFFNKGTYKKELYWYIKDTLNNSLSGDKIDIDNFNCNSFNIVVK